MLISKISASSGMVLTMAQTMYYDELNRREDDWITFLQDHRSNLIANSKIVYLNEKDMVYYRYRLRKYLKEKHNSEQLELATLVTNRYKTAMDFNLSTKYIFIPKIGYVQSLRSLYKTIQIQLNKL